MLNDYQWVTWVSHIIECRAAASQLEKNQSVNYHFIGSFIILFSDFPHSWKQFKHLRKLKQTSDCSFKFVVRILSLIDGISFFKMLGHVSPTTIAQGCLWEGLKKYCKLGLLAKVRDHQTIMYSSRGRGEIIKRLHKITRGMRGTPKESIGL